MVKGAPSLSLTTAFRVNETADVTTLHVPLLPPFPLVSDQGGRGCVGDRGGRGFKGARRGRGREGTR